MDMQVKSMGCGLLDSIYDVIQLSSENNVSSSPLPNTTTEVMEIEPPNKENTSSIANGANDRSEDNGNGHSVLSSLSLSLSLMLQTNGPFSYFHLFMQVLLLLMSSEGLQSILNATVKPLVMCLCK
jgi:hypothetical protein